MSLLRMLAVKSPEAVARFGPVIAQIASRHISFCQRSQFLETLWAEIGAVASPLSASLSSHWVTLITALVKDATVSNSVRRAASKTAAVLREVAKDALADLSPDTRALFEKL